MKLRWLAMAEGVRGDLGQVTKAHAGLYRQLQDLSAQVALVDDEVKTDPGVGGAEGASDGGAGARRWRRLGFG